MALPFGLADLDAQNATLAVRRKLKMMWCIARGHGVVYRVAYGTNPEGTHLTMAHFAGKQLYVCDFQQRSALPVMFGSVDYTYKDTRVPQANQVEDSDGNLWDTTYW